MIVLNGWDSVKFVVVVDILRLEGLSVYELVFDVIDYEVVWLVIDIYEVEIGLIGILVNNVGM